MPHEERHEAQHEERHEAQHEQQYFDNFKTRMKKYKKRLSQNDITYRNLLTMNKFLNWANKKRTWPKDKFQKALKAELRSDMMTGYAELDVHFDNTVAKLQGQSISAENAIAKLKDAIRTQEDKLKHLNADMANLNTLGIQEETYTNEEQSKLERSSTVYNERVKKHDEVSTEKTKTQLPNVLPTYRERVARSAAPSAPPPPYTI